MLRRWEDTERQPLDTVQAAALDAPAYKATRQLGILRSAGLVEARREGTWMCYKLAQSRHRLDVCLRECFRDCLADHQTVKGDLELRRRQPGASEGELIVDRKAGIMLLSTGNSCRSQTAGGRARQLKNLSDSLANALSSPGAER